ncbi:hypothetical protein SSX86_018079 [Deinandra increscens subsp. villosa]|uniref:Bifunctional inhibitor/plant lipid transfer protein/seed storage helical domain-containing protein n=1 Tax=Deinandra increscens subsp. villosa TaxID=3103831 RepID=A0AAP0GUG2_9ASTR
MSVSQIQVTVVVLVVIIALVAGAHGQACPNQLGNLNVCAPFVVPGTSTEVVPSSDCCLALQAVDHDCLCSTIRIATTLPTQCNFPVSCGDRSNSFAADIKASKEPEPKNKCEQSSYIVYSSRLLKRVAHYRLQDLTRGPYEINVDRDHIE